MDDIHLACAFDQGMAIPAFILAYSVKKFANIARKTIFHVLECEKGVLPSYADYFLNSDYFEIRHHKVKLDAFHKYDLSIATVPSRATFARLAIPRIIDNAQRVLYLDCDIIINRPFDDLFDTDMRGFPLAACRDLVHAYFRQHYEGPHQDAAKKLFKKVDTYFNAGVLLIDCVKWRDAGYFDKTIKFLADPPAPLFLADQDALNAVFEDNYLKLDPRWNSSAVQYEFNSQEKELAEAAMLCATDPWIVHFIGRAKPWIADHQKTEFHKLYWALAAESPFVSELIALYKSGPSENTAYVARKLPTIYSDRHVWEFLFTVSRAVERIECAFRIRQNLSSKIGTLGNKIYNEYLESLQAPQS